MNKRMTAAAAGPGGFRGFLARARNEFSVPLRRESYATAQQRPLYAKLLYGLAAPVVAGWLMLAVGLNLAVPQLETVVERHALSFLPDEASSVQALANMGKYFGQGGTNNFVAVLFEGDAPLGEDVQQYHTALMERLDADKEHVITAIDLWSNPKFAPAFESSDKKAAFAYLNLTGNMGTALAMESTQAVRDVIAAHPPPKGVKVYVTGPSAVVNDELLSINRSIVPVVTACALFITAIMLVVYRSLLTAGMPLLVVAVALATARPIVALLGDHEVIGVSIFASSLLAGIILGAGTDYGIFLMGRYQEARRAGEDPATAYYTALRGVQHIVFASGLTVAGATACMSFTRLSIFSTSGLPCTIGILTALAAALTLGPHCWPSAAGSVSTSRAGSAPSGAGGASPPAWCAGPARRSWGASPCSRQPSSCCRHTSSATTSARPSRTAPKQTSASSPRTGICRRIF
jgi:RND superfamily putative drug exporter